MTDPTITPTPPSAEPAPVPTPLLTAQGLAISEKFSTDLASLCNQASQDGMTPNMLSGQLWNMAMLIGFQVKDDVDASIAAASPVSAPPSAPAKPIGPTSPAPSDVIYPSGQIVALHGDAQEIDPWFSLPGGASDRIEIDLASVNYPFTFGVMWKPVGNIAQDEGVLARLDSDDGHSASLLVLNNGATMTQVCDASEAAATAPIYGQQQLADSVSYDNYLLSAAIIVSDAERYTYSSRAGMGAADTSPVHFGAGAKVTLNLGNNADGSQPFAGQIGYPFVIARALSVSELVSIVNAPDDISAL